MSQKAHPFRVRAAVLGVTTAMTALFVPHIATASAAAVDLHCTGEAAPAPQYSASNHTIHWGLKVICNQPAYIQIHDDLLEVVGHGDHEHYVEMDFAVKRGTATNLTASDHHRCGSSVATRWIARGYATVEGMAMSPYPRWSNVHTLACGSW